MYWTKKILAYTIIWTPVIGCLLLLSLCTGMETPMVEEALYITIIRGLGRIALAVAVLIGLGVIIYWAEKTIREGRPHGS